MASVQVIPVRASCSSRSMILWDIEIVRSKWTLRYSISQKHLTRSHITGCCRNSSSMASRVTSSNGFLFFSNLEISVWWLRDRGQALYPWTLESPRVLCSVLSCSSCILMTCPPSFRRKLDSSLATASCIVPLKREATRRTSSPTWMLSNSGAVHGACVSTRRSAISCASAGALDPCPTFIIFVTLFSLR